MRIILPLLCLLLPGLAVAEAACLLGPHSGLDPVDAETAAGIVCMQLRRHGAAVGEPVTEAAGEAYRVTMRPLGRKIFLSVQHIDASNKVVAESELLLAEIEEVPVAAPRLAEALVRGVSVARTASVESLVGEETRTIRKKDGETFWGVGFLAMGVPDTDAVPGAGFNIRTAFETEDFSVLADLRLARAAPGEDEANFFSLGVGTRWFLTGSNWAPFLGLGMGWTAIGIESDDFDGSKDGLGGWVEFGVEALRFYETRLSIDLRAELAFFELEGENWSDDFSFDEPAKRKRYFVPITLGMTYLWN